MLQRIDLCIGLGDRCFWLHPGKSEIIKIAHGFFEPIF